MKKLLSLILSIIILSIPAAAISEQDTAVTYLVEHGIYQGDQNGNLNLNQGLTRAELAVILTRLDFMDSPDDWTLWGQARFSDPETRCNPFTDIPDWALPYIEYCYQRGLMKGVSETRFDPQGKVNPQMAATVMLRFCGVAETDWSYATSVAKAQTLGIAPEDGMGGAAVLRGTMAVMLHRGIMFDGTGTVPIPSTEPEQNQPETPVEQPSAMTIEEMKLEIARLTNEERVKAGLPELEILPALMDCAQAKAQDFLDNNYFGHTSPVYGTAGEMIKAAIPQAKSFGENIGTWSDTPEQTVSGWMNSPEHREFMLSTKFSHIGAGVVEGANGGFAWVLHFVTL